MNNARVTSTAQPTSALVRRARWPALLIPLLLAAALPGCGVLKDAFQSERRTDERRDAIESDTPAESGPDAFAFNVEAEDQDVREYLARHMQLQRFAHLPDLQDAELRRLLGAAEADARELLATLGYFSPTLTIALHDNPAPGAGQRRDTPARTITVNVQPGERTQIAKAAVQVLGSDAPAQRPDAAELQARQDRLQRGFGLQPGAPFTQRDWDDAKSQGLRQLQAQRYALARIDKSRAEVDADRARAELQVQYAPGPDLRFGALQIQGSERYDSEGLRNLARLPVGAPYDQQKLLDTQQRLASSGYYDAVFLALDTEGVDKDAAQATVPVTAQVREAPLQKAVFGVGLSTDTGPRMSLDHTHNRLPLIGWRALSKVELSRKHKLLSTDWTALPGPDGWRWFTGLQLQRETTGSYEVNSSRVRAGRTKGSDHIDRSYFLQFDAASNQGPDAPPSSSAITANYGWTGRYFNDNQNPTSGYGLAAELGVGTTLVPERDLFTRTLVRWQSFIDTGRVQVAEGISRASRLSLRLEGGAVLAREGATIPVTQLFLTGGDTTVRGYGWKKIGARTVNDTLFGGRYLAVGSVEWQRPITIRGNHVDFESATFVDVGAVADKLGDLKPHVGVGAGLRWRSPVGPLQADVAYGVQDRQLRLHLRLGYTF
ncbi:autotransporter secretion outer membrane protein TamA [Oryzisolibacter propanilivorax]|uniref:Autotransporter secretion outer membrane protein TamA n=1 Tax=Oryzisolibacter propanilivorax TaxID=1527607 RepID=A0A1G9RLF1_9BURK|nr:autotransporter secretion outer membrane protein TamA [Oryzisolibacter propanilivorax]